MARGPCEQRPHTHRRSDDVRRPRGKPFVHRFSLMVFGLAMRPCNPHTTTESSQRVFEGLISETLLSKTSQRLILYEGDLPKVCTPFLQIKEERTSSVQVLQARVGNSAGERSTVHAVCYHHKPKGELISAAQCFQCSQDGPGASGSQTDDQLYMSLHDVQRSVRRRLSEAMGS